MNLVHIPPTEKTPDIILDPKGIVRITGRAIDESKSSYPELTSTWLDNYILNPARSTEVMIALEYLNSFNTIIITGILKKIARIRERSGTLFIKWYIEEDDEDLKDRAESIASTFELPVEIIMTDKIKSYY